MVGTPVKPSAPSPMNKPRTNPQRESTSGQHESGRSGTAVRVVVSLLLVWHLSAVFLAPLSVPPSSQLVADIAQQPPMQWYLDLLYLNHGYHFFAPNPGPGHLVRYELLDERGAQIETGEFPNRKEQWPRLWYHRHFMLADQVGIPQPNERQAQLWQQKYLESYARNLLRTHDSAHTVRLRWVAHHQIPPAHGFQGRKLNDPSTYETIMEVTQRRSDLPSNSPDHAMIWQGAPQQISTRPGEGVWAGGVR